MQAYAFQKLLKEVSVTLYLKGCA